MGWVQMSKQDLKRIEVLTEVLAGRRTRESAAAVLQMSVRQAQRLLARYEDGGGAALIHRSRGRRPDLGSPLPAGQRRSIHNRQQGPRDRAWQLRNCPLHQCPRERLCCINLVCEAPRQDAAVG